MLFCISIDSDFQRKDPEQFMQIHGRKCQIHVDPAVARAAEASNILFVIPFKIFREAGHRIAFKPSHTNFNLFTEIFRRKWQGDSKVLIDRFDARAHLDYIMEPTATTSEQRQAHFLMGC